MIFRLLVTVSMLVALASCKPSDETELPIITPSTVVPVPTGPTITLED